jgi:hypothetical protein
VKRRNNPDPNPSKRLVRLARTQNHRSEQKTERSSPAVQPEPLFLPCTRPAGGCYGDLHAAAAADLRIGAASVEVSFPISIASSSCCFHPTFCFLMSSFLPLQALIATLASPVNGSGLMVVSQQHTRWILALVLPLGESLHSRVFCYLGEKKYMVNSNKMDASFINVQMKERGI